MRSHRWRAFPAVVVLLASILIVRDVHSRDKTITIGMVPETGTNQAQSAAPLKTYLSQKLEQDVNLAVPSNYNQTVEDLGNGSLDFAYLGGLTYLKAHKQYGVVPLVQRTSDLEFRSLFICGTNTPIHTLKDLAGKKFSYGDINSTSGHLIPYMEMREAGIDPDIQVHSQYSGSHPATAKAVESGTADAGAIDESIYKALVAEGKVDAKKVRVFYASKPFVDTVWVARKDVSLTLQEKFVNAFLSLKEGQNDDVLGILRAKAYVRANNESYAILRLIAQQLKML